MKQIYFLILICYSSILIAQIPDYYNDLNLNLTGAALKTELKNKITSNVNELSYGDIYNASKITDVNPMNASKVLLVYGYEDGSDSFVKNDRERNLDDTCGSGSCIGLWNREHVYPNSLATPDLDYNGKSGAPYADAHNLRPCDSQTNSTRGNRKFSDEQGQFSGAASSETSEGYIDYNNTSKVGWYPGDEWKGDVARIIMYMYLRYDSQCLPANVGLGNVSSTINDDMIDLFLRWNVEDQVSDFELQRNNYHDSNQTYAQGNRNPFIDNPHFATQIWGGPQAEDKFGNVTDTENPTPPTNITSSLITGTSFCISWTASTDNTFVTGYKVFLNSVEVGTTSSTNYCVTGLSNSTSYSVTIEAYDQSGNTSTISSSLTVNTITDETPPIPSLIITEVADPDDVYQGRFVEIFNNGSTDINLTTEQIHISIQSNGGGINSRALSGILEANTVMIIGNSANINTNYGFNADEDYGSINGNGNDSYFLYYGGNHTSGTLLDAYGVLNEDGTGKNWNYKDSRAVRLNTNSVSPNATWSSAEWMITSADLADMTPGALENEFRYNGDWKPRNISNATSSDNAYITSNLTLTSSLSVNNFEVTSGNTATINGTSLIVNGTSSGNVTYNRNLGTENWYLVSSPVAGETYDDAYVSGNSLAISGTNNAISTYVSASNSWSYMQTGDVAANFTAGQGYSMRLADGQGSGDISFTGTINTASVETSSLSVGYHLLGNPYTSFVNSATFLGAATSSNLDQTQIWLWNQATGMYEVKTSGNAWVLAPGQGFFVNATSAGTVTFDESNQAATGNAFQKSEKTEVKLLLSDGENNRFAKLSFGNNFNKGFDFGWEGETFGGIPNSLSIFTSLIEDNVGKRYQVQSLPNSDYESMVVPVGITADAGKEITFSAEALNLPSDIKVFLEDRVHNTFTRLDEANATYKITLTEALDGVGRFYVHTTQSALSIDTIALNSVSIFKTNAATLRVTGLQQGTASLSLFNVLGKQVMSTSFEATASKDIFLPKLAKGIYFAQVQTAAGNLSKKIIIE